MPAKPLESIEAAWTDVSIRLDVRNLAESDEAGTLPVELMKARVDENNRYWSLCAIKFVPRTVANVSAQKLNIPYPPQSQGELSTLASVLNPNGKFDGAIPFTFAGPWNFYDKQSKLFLHGLGWFFMTGDKIDHIGAMIASQRIHRPEAPLLMAHELGHALTLGHTSEPDNIMGVGERFSRVQCMQARAFALTALAGFLESR